MNQPWTRLELHEVCRLITDGTHHSPPNTTAGAFKYVTAKNIRRHGLDLRDITYVDAATHREIYARCPVEFGDVLYIKDGVTTGLAAINHLTEPFSLLSSVALLKPRTDVVDAGFLKHWLNSPATFETMTGNMTGSAIRRLVLKSIRSAPIDVPSLGEQQRIVAKLNTLLDRVDACRERLERVGPLIKRFRQSVLHAAITGELTHERGDGCVQSTWRALTLGDVATDVRYGTSKRCEYRDRGLGVLRIPNIGATGRLELTDMKRAEFDGREVESLALRPGDLLVIRSNGSLDLVGRTAVVGEEAAGLLYAGYLIRLRLDRTLIDPQFAYLLLASPSTRQRIATAAKSTSGVNNVNASELRALPIALPPMPEQLEAVRRAQRLLAWADSLEHRLARSQRAVSSLTPATLAKAFRGELVPQDPNDEPASALLARLQAEREAAAPASKTKRARRARSGG
jgi:type I restriction enzyme S subunit